jgi:2-phosphosulfolactate phosphatase
VDIDITGPEDLDQLRGVVVVIDVLRAFTTAAFAFGAGASDIVLVSTVAEAVALRERFPGALLVGEVGGYPIEGFDFGNSPFELDGRALDGVRLIQRTTSGTRVAVESRNAEAILTASFVCAEATVQHILRLAPSSVALVVSGRDRPDGGGDDLACADYLAARLRGEPAEVAPFLERLRESSGARRFLDPAKTAFPIQDLELALQADRFDFAMVAARRDELLVLERAPGTAA